MLTKIKISEKQNINNIKIHPLIQKVIDYDFISDSVYFTNGKYVLNNKSNNTYVELNGEIVKLNNIDKIPIIFGKYRIWKSINVFDQNNYNVANNIRNYVIFILKNSIDNINYKINTKHKSILHGIGGEFYGYFINLDYYDFYIGYSNNLDILKCAEFNMNIYKLNTKYTNHLINYNNCNSNINSNSNNNINSNNNCITKINNVHINNIIINLSVITYPIIDHLLNNRYDNIIIINCKSKNIFRLKQLFSIYKLKFVKWFGIVNIIYLSIF